MNFFNLNKIRRTKYVILSDLVEYYLNLCDWNLKMVTVGFIYYGY